MPDSYKALERQVQRIHRLLEDAGASVIWNERIPDPDNPEQLRQIDVSIRRDGTFTMIECRDHKSPQDVKWIEEIIGRRISLEADSVIAVSSSGFTRGAKAKAINNGVILRDFATLTDNEISEWGQRSEFSLIFCEFRDVKLLLEVTGVPTRQPALTTESGKSIDLSEIKIPDRCIFCSPVFHDPNGIVASNAEIVGTANIMKFNIKVDIEIAWNRIVVIR